MRARSVSCMGTYRLHSRERYYGAYVVLYTVFPSILLFFVWSLFSPSFIDIQVHAKYSSYLLNLEKDGQEFSYGIVKNIAQSLPFLDASAREEIKSSTGDISNVLSRSHKVILANVPETWMVDAAFYTEDLSFKSQMAMIFCMFILSFLGCVYSSCRINSELCAQGSVEKFLVFLLSICAVLSVFISLGIMVSMFSNSLKFFHIISAKDFFFGTVWDPRFASIDSPNATGQFGLIPLLVGTFYIGFVAMLFAVPIGLLVAIYMAEYASKRLRSIIKPITEMLVGIPTIIYGFFAVSVIGPLLRDISVCMNGLVTGHYKNFIESQSVLTAGLVMGLMLIPYISSLSEDVISAVPRSLRDGSLGLGATRSETMKHVILPAAFPGIAGAILMAASRTIGETMIVVLVAGVTARLQFSPFESMTTITVKIMNQLTGDLEFTSPQNLVAFALGLTLFLITFFLNVCAMYIMQKNQRRYE
ncbi:phosphate ABC transporter permease subunit PstC [Liberibacter sp. Z1]|nr:phosphate ABC transporter permease subunit PstC [Candidatus Liberibacter sp.]